MSKKLFNEMREREAQEEVTIEVLKEMEVTFEEVVNPVTFDELKTLQLKESFIKNEQLSKEETDRQEMPFDFWNHGFNGHSGFKPDYYE